ncbi:MAG: adenylate cyclase regulatory domain-containing protein [Ilumatobacteraceae bacterium]|nr:adenylate cyclase regulatory domain-containing protein [Ilumatobacteraceae bacterium]
MPTADDYQRAGLFDPDVDAEAGRIELLDWLVEQGFTIPEMQHALATDALGAMAGDRRMVPGERLSRAEAIERSNLTPEEFDAYARAFGFVPIEGAPEGEIGFTEAEIESLASVAVLASTFSADEAKGLVRVIASSLARIGEASVSLFLADIESPHLLSGAKEIDLAHAVHDAVGLLDGLTERLDPILRRQMLQAVERTRRTSIDMTERFQYRYAVGFVDLVGFTALSRHMGARELSAFMGRFEGEAHDVATSAGARVVKLIGDEVMFVATDPVAACRAAIALMDAFNGEYVGVAPRGGMAYGNVVLRSGDYYGSVVNLASRLVDEAVPLELLVTDGLVEAAVGCEFEPAGRRMVKGFDEPVAVWSMQAGPRRDRAGDEAARPQAEQQQ